MKKISSIILSFSIFIVLFIACSNDSTQQILPIIPPAVTPTTPTTTTTTAPVTFDFSNAKAIAHMGDVNSRAANDTDEYVKILTDGTFETAIKLTGTGNLSRIVGIYPSPTTSGDVFVVFENRFSLMSGYNVQYIGQLICVHSDGTYDDILKVGTNSSAYTNYLRLTTSSITFDKNGNLYFFASIEYDSNGNWINNPGQQIYQYKPVEKQLNRLVAAVSGITYEKMQISTDSAFIFAQGYGAGTGFIRAIPIENPENFVNIVYGANAFAATWVYDDRNGKFYYYGYVGNVNGLYVYTRAGNFSDGTMIAKNAAVIIPNLFNEFFSDNISANDLLSKLSSLFEYEIKINIRRTSYTNTNGAYVSIFSELDYSTIFENIEALNWLK